LNAAGRSDLIEITLPPEIATEPVEVQVELRPTAPAVGHHVAVLVARLRGVSSVSGGALASRRRAPTRASPCWPPSGAD